MIPSSYQEWQHCIKVKCGIGLTQKFIEERLSELQNDKNPKTVEFVNLYGIDYKNQIISWFEKASFVPNN